MKEVELRAGKRRTSVEQRGIIRRMKRRRDNDRRLYAVVVEVERRLFAIRRMIRRRVMLRRKVDRRMSFDRRMRQQRCP